ncbi:NUMOD3 domain-containing DNA-binding protein [Prevotella melaninogenica]|jgi:NUMOD3 motif
MSSKGYKHTEEARKKISEAQKKRYANMTEEQKQARISKIKARWQQMNDLINMVNAYQS